MLFVAVLIGQLISHWARWVHRFRILVKIKEIFGAGRMGHWDLMNGVVHSGRDDI